MKGWEQTQYPNHPACPECEGRGAGPSGEFCHACGGHGKMVGEGGFDQKMTPSHGPVGGPLDPMSDGSESPLERAMRDDGSTRRATTKEAWDDHAEQENFEQDPAIAEWQNAVMSGETQLGFEEWVLQDESDGGMPEYAETSLGNEDRFGSAKTAVETGDTYTQETVDLPKATPEGSDEPSPKMDKGNAGDELHTSQKPIDVPSVANPVEQQDVTQHADYTKTLDVPGVVKTVNADTPTQPEHNVAPGTQTFKNKDQANPVTSKWKVIG